MEPSANETRDLLFGCTIQLQQDMNPLCEMINSSVTAEAEFLQSNYTFWSKKNALKTNYTFIDYEFGLSLGQDFPIQNLELG